MQKLQIFVVRSNDEFRLGLCRNPLHLVNIWRGDLEDIIILSTPLPSTEAYLELTVWKRRFLGRFSKCWWHYLRFKQTHTLPARSSNVITKDDLTPILSNIETLLSGRLLCEQRLFSTLRQEGYWPSDVSRALDWGIFSEKIIQLPGFKEEAWGQIVCNRCNSTNVTKRPCLTCGKSDCLYCKDCSTMGKNRGCSVLLAVDKDDDFDLSANAKLELTYELTAAQQNASDKLLDSWSNGIKQTLIWAACGAGKTEVTFSLIQKVLNEGKQVLFAIPRQAIVREMAQRLEKAFPETAVAVHYGGQPWFAHGNLVVATTHQVLHFRNRFHLAILDEVDAFPYHGSEMLRFGLLRSLRPQGHLVEMTATPNFQNKFQHTITIPARYHGYPLPEPRLIHYKLPLSSQLESQDLPSFVVEKLKQRGSWLVFVPTIAACTVLRDCLSEVLAKPVGICHSQEPNRDQTIMALKTNKLDVVVTTSILERGVNFPGIEVMVLYADHPLFSTSALVQIAGRVGRSAEFPVGRVFFIGNRVTASMRGAQNLIKKLNNEAREQGLLPNEKST